MSKEVRNRVAGSACLKIIVTLTAVSLFGCPACPVDEVADIRAIHLSPDAPAVDVWRLDPDRTLFTGLSFTDSSAFRTLDEGTYSLEVTLAGAPVTEGVLTIDDLQLEEDGIYTAAVFGFADSLDALFLTEDFSDLEEGEARIRVIHTAPEVGEVDVWNISDPENPVPLVENISLGDASAYLEVPAEAYVIGLDLTGDEEADLVFELPALTGGDVVNLFALQDADGDAFILAHFADGTTARVEARPEAPELGDDEAGLRVVHLSFDAPAVDIWGPDVPLVTALSFTEGTDYLAVPSDIDLVEIVPAGQPRDQAVLSVEIPGLEAGEYYTGVAVGPLADIELLLLLDDLTQPAPGSIRFRPIHAAAGVPEVDVWVARPEADPIIAFEDLVFGEVADYILAPAGRYSVGLDVGRDGLIDFVAPSGDLTAATVANIYVVLDEDDVFLLVQENGRNTRYDAELQDPPLPPAEALPLAE